MKKIKFIIEIPKEGIQASSGGTNNIHLHINLDDVIEQDNFKGKYKIIPFWKKQIFIEPLHSGEVDKFGNLIKFYKENKGDLNDKKN